MRRVLIFVTYGRRWLIIVTETKGNPPARAVWPISRSARLIHSPAISMPAEVPTASSSPGPSSAGKGAYARFGAPSGTIASRSQQRGPAGVRELDDKIPRTLTLVTIGIPRFPKLVSTLRPRIIAKQAGRHEFEAS